MALAAQCGMTLIITRLAYAVPEVTRRLIDIHIPSGDTRALIGSALLIVLIPLGSRAIGLVGTLLRMHVSHGVQFSIQKRVLDGVLNAPPGKDGKLTAGDVLTLVGTDCPTLAGGVLQLAESALQTAYSIALAFRLLWAISPVMVGTCLLAAALRYPVQRWNARLLAEGATIRRKWQSAASTAIVDTLSGIRTVQIYSLETARSSSIASLFRFAFLDGLTIEKKSQMCSCLDTVMNSIAPSVAFGYGGYLVITGRASLGAVVATAQYLARGVDSIGALIGVFGRIQPIQVHADNLSGFLTADPREEGYSEWPTKRITEISLESVSFGYEGSCDMLMEAVSMGAKAGEIVAICGKSGSGKTTLGHIICGLSMPTTGLLFADGLAVTPARQRAYRRRTALVTERDYVFIGSILENLLIADPDASGAKIQESLALSLLDEVVCGCPDGLSTRVGRGGFELSSGEKQRLSLARAILRSPDVVVLDEVTANIDLTMERVLFERLSPWLRMRIVIVISHRPQTIGWADRVLHLVDGRLLQASIGEIGQEGVLSR